VDMAVLLVEGWPHPSATSAPSASPVRVRIEAGVMTRKLGPAKYFYQ